MKANDGLPNPVLFLRIVESYVHRRENSVLHHKFLAARVTTGWCGYERLEKRGDFD